MTPEVRRPDCCREVSDVSLSLALALALAGPTFRGERARKRQTHQNDRVDVLRAQDLLQRVAGARIIPRLV